MALHDTKKTVTMCSDINKCTHRNAFLLFTESKDLHAHLAQADKHTHAQSSRPEATLHLLSNARTWR